MEGSTWLLIIVANLIISYYGFRNAAFFNSWTFEVSSILKDGQWYRIISAAFLHVSGTHLAFNMLSLYFFAGSIEAQLGSVGFLIIYLSSLLGGNLFSLFIHRNNPAYRAVGASGAVSGVIFAAIALFPGMELAFIFVPIPFPAWVYGLGFVLYSIYGIRSQKDNIGHEAHLGGAIIGLLVAIAYEPAMMEYNQLAILLILVPTSVFIIIIIYRPRILLIEQKYSSYQDQDDEFREQRAAKQEELDRILEKVGREGIDSLSKDEKELLDRYSS